MELPCWHIFAVRASQNLPVFKVQLVARRWHKNYQLLINESEVSVDHDEGDNGSVF